MAERSGYLARFGGTAAADDDDYEEAIVTWTTEGNGTLLPTLHLSTRVLLQYNFDNMAF